MRQVSQEHFIAFLNAKLSHHACTKCGNEGLYPFSDRGSLHFMKLSASPVPAHPPDEAHSFHNLLAYHCVSCGSVEFVAEHVVADWVQARYYGGKD